MFNFCVSFHRENAKWWIYIYYVTLLQKMSNRVQSHDLPRQAIGPALSTQHCCSSFKSFFISQNHQTWGFHLLIPHKQNPHTKINQLAVTAKILSQPGIQLCVASVAVQSRKQIFMGCMRDFPGFFNIHVSSEHRSYCDSPQMRKIFQLHYGAVNQSPSQQICQCLATAAIALCLHSVQQCGCKIILRERK